MSLHVTAVRTLE